MLTNNFWIKFLSLTSPVLLQKKYDISASKYYKYAIYSLIFSTMTVMKRAGSHLCYYGINQFLIRWASQIYPTKASFNFLFSLILWEKRSPHHSNEIHFLFIKSRDYSLHTFYFRFKQPMKANQRKGVYLFYLILNAKSSNLCYRRNNHFKKSEI